MRVRIWVFERACAVTRIVVGFWLVWFSATARSDESGERFFRERVRPILVERCHKCHSHSARKLKGNLMLDSREAALQGGDSGAAFVPGDPDMSLIIQGVRYDDVDFQMPPKSKLSEEEILVLEEWVKQGAPWPGGDEGQAPRAAKGFDLEARRKSHWAWQPVKAVAPPEDSKTGWSVNPVDRFILQRLESENVDPAPRADRRTLIRRLSFVLRGVPPSVREVRDFESDRSEKAYEDLVDRMLESPMFGERWARHWMDVMRYSETLGHEFDYVIPNAWRYRDYLIRAINDDVPYDQFVREHIAGDLLSSPRIDQNEGLNMSAIATASFWFGQQVHSPVDVKAYQLEVIDNQIDTLSRGFQALTVSCARCHDHKFDAISTRDFYALYGVLESSRYVQRDAVSVRRRSAETGRLRQLRDELQTIHDAGGAPEDPGGREDQVRNAFESSLIRSWFFEGAAFEDAEVERGDLLFTRSDQPVEIATAPIYSSRKLSVRLQGMMHSKTFDITNRYLHLFVAGQGARAKVVIENFQVIRNPIYGGIKKLIDNPEFHWMTFDLGMWQGQHAYLELVDQTVPDLGDALRGDGYPADAWFDLAGVVASDEQQPPGSEKPVSPTALGAEEYAVLARIDATPLGDPVYVPALADGEGLDEHVFIRGGPRKPGELVERRFLEALGGLEDRARHGSGRLAIAERIASPENPLTARVWVNRVWHHLFGRGLVATVDDFGVLGKEPSHPELLDWLADWFVGEGGWSTKRLIRLLVTTSTWRQSAIAEERFDESDPRNLLLHKWTVRRLEGEAIRDSILAASGRLDRTMYGPPVPIHLTAFMTGRGRPGTSGPVDGDGRRSIYTASRRNFMSPMMLAFDTPQAAQTFGARARSNVPAQALILLNAPFVHDEARRLAATMLKETIQDTSRRVDRLYQTCFQRDPTADERGIVGDFLMRRSTEDPAGAWADVCHMLFNAKEFLFVN